MTVQDICEKAEELEIKYNPEGLSPFPFEKIVEDQKDIKLINAEISNTISGAILKAENHYFIIVNPNKPATRQQFTLAHEFGHYFLHKAILDKGTKFIDGDPVLDSGTILLREDNADPNQLEREANNFAASLIMPESLVKKAWETFKDIEACAKVFNVSGAAMSIRLERLGLID